MLRTGFIVATTLLTSVATRAADATRPVDYVQRNQAFAPAPTVQAEKKTPPMAEDVQEKRVDKNVVEKTPAAVGDRRAPLSVTESATKNVREKSSTRPEGTTVQRSTLDHRTAAIATGEAEKPATVAKYQESLTAASASNMARFPALDGATTAKLNRFVFRKNGPETAGGPAAATVTPAGGGSAVTK